MLTRVGLPGAKHAEDTKLFVGLQALNPVSVPFVQSMGLYDLLWQPAVESTGRYEHAIQRQEGIAG